MSGVVLFCVRFDVIVVFLCSCVGFVGSSWEILSGEVVKVGSYAVVCVRGVTVELGFGEKIRLLRFECSSIVSSVVSVRFFFPPRLSFAFGGSPLRVLDISF